MARVLIAYHSRTGHTHEMAQRVAEGVCSVAGATADVRAVDEVKARSLLDYDAVIFGSPTYYGTMASPIKRLFEESVAFHGQLDGKVGGAFSSSGNVGGGSETVVMDVLKSLLVHGMVVQGTASGAHFGPVAIGSPDELAGEECRKLGRNVAALAIRLHG
jgi:NAD(P)H dehydrogenase (quinone)